jgi:acetoin utilization protein AcuB
MRAGTLMTIYPATVKLQATIAEAMDLMGDLDVRHLPVVDRGALVGVVSDRELPYRDLVMLLMDQRPDALSRVLETPVVEVMRSAVIAVEPETELRDVIGLLLEHKLGAITVVHPDTRAVLGIISYIDVFRAVQDSLEDD